MPIRIEPSVRFALCVRRMYDNTTGRPGWARGLYRDSTRRHPGEQSRRDASQRGHGANLLQQVEEMVKQNYNHPSVALWGMANEIGFVRRYTPKLEREFTQELLARMRNVAHTLDPSRPTIQADVGGQPPYSKEEDTVALNRYYAWYDPDLNDERTSPTSRRTAPSARSSRSA